MYKIRVILDTKEDVIRTFTINNSATLETLHHTITRAFGFNGTEIASFYRTDNSWNQGEEIPLFNMSETEEGISMATEMIQQTLAEKNSKLIYVYDFLKMWTFYVEVIEITTEKCTSSNIILSIGEVPTKAPEKTFETDNLNENFTNNFEDDNSLDYFEDGSY